MPIIITRRPASYGDPVLINNVISKVYNVDFNYRQDVTLFWLVMLYNALGELNKFNEQFISLLCKIKGIFI